MIRINLRIFSAPWRTGTEKWCADAASSGPNRRRNWQSRPSYFSTTPRLKRKMLRKLHRGQLYPVGSDPDAARVATPHVEDKAIEATCLLFHI